MSGNISIKGARVNNLKNISLEIPRGKFVVVTGVSGSGKSSLAFDTLFAEGQRRFAQSLSSYARQFLGRMGKPDVDLIDGIPPAVAIEQKVNVKNPRSTVATTTEIYDYLRLIFARIGHTFSPVSGNEVHADSVTDVAEWLADCLAHQRDGRAGCFDRNTEPTPNRVEMCLHNFPRCEGGKRNVNAEGRGGRYGGGTPIEKPRVAQPTVSEGSLLPPVLLLADIKWKTRTDHTELLLSLKEQGYSRLYADGRPVKIEDVLQAAEMPSNAELLVDRFSNLDDRARLLSSIDDAFRSGDGRIALAWDGGRKEFCNRFELDGIKFARPDDFLFSFNSPLGACPVCGGLGKIIGISEDLVIPDKTKTLYDGAIACWRGDKMGWFKDQLCRVAGRYGIDIFTPYCQLPKEQIERIWEGDPPKEGEQFDTDSDRLVGINEFFQWVETQRYKIQYKFMLNRFSGRATCHACHGSRLRKEALYVKVYGKTIAQVLDFTVEEALAWFTAIKGSESAPSPLTESELDIIAEPLSEILSRLQYIMDVGLGYLTLSRACNTLSGGESQRINLVTALGSSLVGSMYILDEPSIGLHPRDTERLIGVLKKLRDLGNTVIVVEHDEEIIRAADVLIDMGPRAGSLGGRIIFQGKIPSDASELSPADIAQSLTLQYLTGARKRYERTVRPWNYSITVKGAMEHNLKGMDVQFPLGVLTVVTGVSGSGKSSLVGDILYPAMYRHIHEAGDIPGSFMGLEGNLDRITRVEYVDQNPIGRSTRSNPVTYLKIYDLIRVLLASQQYAKINGFTHSFFSFNQEGGRCPECQGEGVVTIEMQFMSDVTMVCDECHGKRFKPEILEVRYRDKNVDDILNMSISEAIEFFAAGPEPEAKQIAEKLQPLVDVGLEYLKLGQSSATLSGGESQRIKLAYFLSMCMGGTRDRIMFIFDEPTTGLHFHDVEKLLKAFDKILEKGHSLIVVEHNLDVIRSADWIIDLGPDAGSRGGQVVFTCTPAALAAEAASSDSVTAKYL